MKTLGIVGGIAPASTIEYYRMLIAAYQAKRPDGSLPPVIINSIDMQTMLRLIAADALDEVTSYLVAEVEKLARAGSEVGLFASNTPHIVFDAVQERSPIPLISIVDATYAAVQSMGLTRVGLIGTKFTMQGPTYSRPFARRGMTLVTPDDADQTYIHDKYMGELVRAEFLPETRSGIIAAIERLAERHAIDAVILGGTELPLILKDVRLENLPFLDTGRIHVEAALERMEIDR